MEFILPIYLQHIDINPVQWIAPVHRIAQSILCGMVLVGMILSTIAPAIALPPPEDIPEEVLRNAIITSARSPLDGRPMTAAEYAELQADLAQAPPVPPQVSPKVKKVVNLLRLRQFLKTFFPFIPIK